MTNIERHQHILEQIEGHGKVHVLDLCKLLNVSSVTIRKDLKTLEEKGLLYRTHGGATAINPYTMDRTVFEKEKLFAEEKSLIARTAASMVDENDSIIIASGTTVQAMAREIVPIGALTVVTAALNVSLQLIKHQNVEILQLGGLLRKSSTSVAGLYAESILSDFYCSKLFMGVDGIDVEYGLTTTNAQEAHLNRKMMNVAQKTIVLADSSKFGKRGFGRICPAEEVDVVITDPGIPEKSAMELEKMGIQVIIVGK
ncbi:MULTISPECIES: DeoR/GlpR family DNA-binding transcription regulator [Sphingobacterium]|uniref:DeoR/GlpR family DNA-binding transcription regulator n=1 Tax=Sphingobacterium populi TaxID=1812824 RepID=A0ABW5UA52_9SPHI|nr:DeoR/GlpR family DNA-binding transcription regulator [Sphingobacterium sp. CFCC 11742]